MVGGGGVCGDSVVRVGGSSEALLPVAGSAASAASAIGAIASATGCIGSATAGSNLSAMEPPAMEPPATELPLAAGGCRLRSGWATPAADGSRTWGGSQSVRSAAAGKADPERAVAMLNMDMVGRMKDNKLTVYGIDTATEFAPLITRLNQPYGFKIIPELGGFGPSDHIVTHCEGGGRAALGAAAAVRAGFDDVRVYYLSFADWVRDESCPIVRD